MTTWAPVGQPWAVVAWRDDAASYRVIRCTATRDEAEIAQITLEIDFPEGDFGIIFRPCAAELARKSRLHDDF